MLSILEMNVPMLVWMAQVYNGPSKQDIHYLPGLYSNFDEDGDMKCVCV